MASANRKSILFLPRWYPNKNDIQLGTFIRQQAILLKDEFDIHVIYVQADSDLRQDYEFVENSSHGIHEITVYFKSGNGVFGKLINAKRYKEAQRLAYQKIKSQIDLCHVHVPYRPAFLALHLLRTKNIPFVITEHWSGHLTGEFDLKNFADKRLYKKVLSKASAISCVSNLLSKKFKQNTGYDSVVIPNCIEHFPITEDKIESGRIQILSVSDMTDAIKNISGLLHAFKAALQSTPNLYLTLIGGGPDEDKILNLIADLKLQSHISFKGRLNHESVLHEMNSCDFYICNSNFETFGMTVAEALRCGKPVISTRCGGPEEFLHDRNSILISPENNTELTQAILKMAAELDKYNSEKMAAEIESKFGATSVRNLWIRFYSDNL